MASFQVGLQRYQLTSLHFSEVIKYPIFLMQNKVFSKLMIYFYFLL